jgi:hypothetical protein
MTLFWEVMGGLLGPLILGRIPEETVLQPLDTTIFGCGAGSFVIILKQWNSEGKSCEGRYDPLRMTEKVMEGTWSSMTLLKINQSWNFSYIDIPEYVTKQF